MNTRSEKTGSEQLTKTDIERAKEMVKQFINNQNVEKKYKELFSGAVFYLMQIFGNCGYVPISLLEYADKASIEKIEKRWVR